MLHCIFSSHIQTISPLYRKGVWGIGNTMVAANKILELVSLTYGTSLRAPLCRFDWLHLGIVHSHMHSALGLHNRSLLHRVLSSLTPIAQRSSKKNKVCRPLSQTLNQGLAAMLWDDTINEKAKPWFRVWLKEAATYSPTGKPQYHRRE